MNMCDVNPETLRCSCKRVFSILDLNHLPLTHPSQLLDLGPLAINWGISIDKCNRMTLLKLISGFIANLGIHI